jgi:hypothetical protein
MSTEQPGWKTSPDGVQEGGGRPQQPVLLDQVRAVTAALYPSIGTPQRSCAGLVDRLGLISARRVARRLISLHPR